MDHNQWPIAFVGLSSVLTSILIGAKVLRSLYFSKKSTKTHCAVATKREATESTNGSVKDEKEPFLVIVPTKEDYKKDPELLVPLSKRINWPMVAYMTGVHGLSLFWLLTVLLGKDTTLWQTYAFTAILWPLTGFGITAGAHRLWAHRSYKASRPLRLILMILNSIANQGSIFHWARDHRTHHLFSDTPADPYDSYRGVFFSHMGWLLVKKHSRVVESSRRFVDMEDLKQDPFVMIQKRYDPLWNLFWCFVFPSLIPMLWGETFFQGYLVSGVVRYILVLHATWTVNSVVHKWGPKPYQKPPAKLAVKEDPDEEKTITSTLPMSRDNVTTESPLVSLLALGEGWHSWHHAFPWDYSTAELEIWQQYNPTKAFIDLMALFGLARHRKRALQTWALRKQCWLEDAKKAHKVSERAYIKEGLEGWPLFSIRTLDVVDPLNRR